MKEEEFINAMRKVIFGIDPLDDLENYKANKADLENDERFIKGEKNADD